ncbi:MAG: RNA-binding protein [Firmicutes bacterium]|mgnify:FL=1|jgi:ribosomal protein L14E/L6E/L27E|nr:RNA-binding protein [Bacillota bacterium]
MDDLRPGQLVRSKAGRDKGKHYLVIKVNSPREVLLADGRSRPLSRPKKKNVIHLQRYSRWVDIEELIRRQKLTDSQVIKFIEELAPAEEEV